MTASILTLRSYEDITKDLKEIVCISERTTETLRLFSGIPGSFILVPELVEGLIRIPGALRQIFRNCKTAQRFVTETRWFIEKQGRPEKRDLSVLTEEVRKLRDNFILLYELVSECRFFFFMEGMIRETLDELDELAQDLVIGSDDEIRDLILQIAELCDA